MSNKFAVTSVPVMQVVEERWSPRAFDVNHVLTEKDLTAAFEAARWAPSASNIQPARFVAAFRGTPGFETILNNLVAANARWAKNASALVVNIAEVHDAEGRERRWAEYDLGQAVSYFSIQAHTDGLFVHQMGGFSGLELEQDLGLPESQRVVTVMAVGIKTDANNVELSENHLKQELSERTRNDLSSNVRFI